MTVTEAVDYCRNRHNAVSDSFFDDAEIYKLIEGRANMALSWLGLIQATDTSLVTVSSQQAYNYPSNFVFIKKVLVDNYPLVPITFEEWDSEHTRGSTDPSGTPERVVIWNNQLLLVPIPTTAGKTIKIYGEKQQSSITTSSSTIDIPAVLHIHLLPGVIADMFAKDKDASMMDRYESVWNNQSILAFQNYAVKRRSSAGFSTVFDTDPWC